jgi:YYY domain-containing protein
MGWGDRQFWQTVGVKGLSAAGEGTPPLEGTWWWRASRVIPNIPPDGITEFPYFSFLLGDLHPHYTAIPLNLAIVGVALVVLARATSALRGTSALGITGAILAAVLLGVLVAANTWDVPTLWGLLFGASALAVWRRYHSWAEARGELGRAAVPFLLAPLMIAPYFVGYSSQPLGLALVGERTPVISLLILFGPLLLAIVAFALRLGISHGYGPARRDVLSWPAAIGVGIAALLVWLREVTFVLLGAWLALLAWAAVRSSILSRSDGRGTCSARTFCWLLAVLGMSILASVEILYIRDVFGTRMNTVFKFHYDAWVLLALSSAGGLGLLWQRRALAWRIPALAIAALIVLPGFAYPLAATWTKSGAFGGAATLDGSRFLQRSRPADHQAILWLQANTSDRPVVIEAVGPDYQEFARVSTFSGLPTIMGWIGHELQWRGDRIDYGRRQQDVDAIYRSNTLEELLARAQPYRARYLFFGSLERDRYGPEAQQRLSRLLRPVYGQGGTSIFLVPRAEDEERSP